MLTEALLILKYGGVLTHAGRAQAEELGKVSVRCVSTLSTSFFFPPLFCVLLQQTLQDS